MEMNLSQVVTSLLFLEGILLYSTVVRAASIMHSCTDFQGKTVEHGILYVPGPSVCSVCVCYNSEPKWCQTMYCNPPIYCRVFRVGVGCCDFLCLDNRTKNWTNAYTLRSDLYRSPAPSNFNIFGKFYALLALLVAMMGAPIGPL